MSVPKTRKCTPCQPQPRPPPRQASAQSLAGNARGGKPLPLHCRGRDCCQRGHRCWHHWTVQSWMMATAPPLPPPEAGRLAAGRQSLRWVLSHCRSVRHSSSICSTAGTGALSRDTAAAGRKLAPGGMNTSGHSFCQALLPAVQHPAAQRTFVCGAAANTTEGLVCTSDGGEGPSMSSSSSSAAALPPPPSEPSSSGHCPADDGKSCVLMRSCVPVPASASATAPAKTASTCLQRQWGKLSLS